MFARPIFAATSMLLLVTGASAADCDARAYNAGDNNNVVVHCTVIKQDALTAVLQELARGAREGYSYRSRWDSPRHYDHELQADPHGYGYGYAMRQPRYIRMSPGYPPVAPYGGVAPRFMPYGGPRF